LGRIRRLKIKDAGRKRRLGEDEQAGYEGNPTRPGAVRKPEQERGGQGRKEALNQSSLAAPRDLRWRGSNAPRAQGTDTASRPRRGRGHSPSPL
jgi:hypothetical protein